MNEIISIQATHLSGTLLSRVCLFVFSIKLISPMKDVILRRTFQKQLHCYFDCYRHKASSHLSNNECYFAILKCNFLIAMFESTKSFTIIQLILVGKIHTSEFEKALFKAWNFESLCLIRQCLLLTQSFEYTKLGKSSNVYLVLCSYKEIKRFRIHNNNRRKISSRPK